MMSRPTNEPLLRGVMTATPENLQRRLHDTRWVMRCTTDPHEISTIKAACRAHALQLLTQPPDQRFLPQTLALVSRPDRSAQGPSPAAILASLSSRLQLEPSISPAGGGGGKQHYLPKDRPTICKGDASFHDVEVELTAHLPIAGLGTREVYHVVPPSNVS